MSDFLLDLRDVKQRDPASAVVSLRFFPDLSVHRFERGAFALVLTRSDSPELWAPFESEDQRLLVALAGRVAWDGPQWETAQRMPERGGLACKAIARLYEEGGEDALTRLNGNFALLLHDAPAGKLFLCTDRWGMLPCFRHESGRVYASHPDALASATGEHNDWDAVSQTEFVMCGRVSAPHTYYRRIKALPPARILTMDLADLSKPAGERVYFQARFEPDRKASIEELAEALGQTFRRAVARRTYPFLGRTAVALSGGLDSRALLSWCSDVDPCVAFCAVDHENQESTIARQVSESLGVPFVLLQRSADFYGENAELGVRISGGMGSIANNHFLGFRDWMRHAGIANLLTGCYCDYLFKGLVLDKRISRLTGRQSLGAFRQEHYFRYVPVKSRYAGEVMDRQKALISPVLRADSSDEGRLEIERRRTFPLCYEGDNMQRVVPQRVLPWSLPIADNEILDLYLKIPPAMKLNRRLFCLMMQKACPASLLRIPDANTGTRIGATTVELAARRLQRAVARRWPGRRPRSAEGSWPDWFAYIGQSPSIRRLWTRDENGTIDPLRGLVGAEQIRPGVGDYTGADLYLFLRLLTLKIWMDLRAA